MPPAEGAASAPDPEVFDGTVGYYVRYRPDFPDAAYRAITDAFGLDGSSGLIDLGTGSGHIALKLADRFETVLGIDVSAEMLAAARQASEATASANIEWRLGRAEDLGLPDHRVRLVTIGNALHWMDRETVLARCHAVTEVGGGIALLDMPGMWSPTMELGAEPWLTALRDVIEQHLGTRRRAGDGYYEPQHESPATSLARAGYQSVEVGTTTSELVWSADEVIGYLYSTSFANRAILGDRVEAFEADLRAALAAAEPSGRFHRQLQTTWTLGYRR